MIVEHFGKYPDIETYEHTRVISRNFMRIFMVLSISVHPEPWFENKCVSSWIWIGRHLFLKTQRVINFHDSMKAFCLHFLFYEKHQRPTCCYLFHDLFIKSNSINNMRFYIFLYKKRQRPILCYLFYDFPPTYYFY